MKTGTNGSAKPETGSAIWKLQYYYITTTLYPLLYRRYNVVSVPFTAKKKEKETLENLRDTGYIQLMLQKMMIMMIF